MDGDLGKERLELERGNGGDRAEEPVSTVTASQGPTGLPTFVAESEEMPVPETNASRWLFPELPLSWIAAASHTTKGGTNIG